MRIILVSPRGFCAGVNMAIESLRLALEVYGVPVYVFHEIVHNRWVVERFRQLGAVFVDDLAEVPEGATLLYSAHGVSPQVRGLAAQRGLRTIDATCPLVTKVHQEAIRYAAAGYQIVFIGHAGHDEVIGTMGEVPDSIVLVQAVDDVDRLVVADPSKLVYLMQTTLSLDDSQRIVEKLRQRFPAIIGPPRDDICYATQNRQEAIRRLARQADCVLVVGSQNSSNSKRLAELARSACLAEYPGEDEGDRHPLGDAPFGPLRGKWSQSPLEDLGTARPAYTATHLIDGPADIRMEWFSGDEVVAITAGASAPEDVVQQCVVVLQQQFAATVTSESICDERTRFALPQGLRETVKDE